MSKVSKDSWSKELKQKVKIYFIEHCTTPESLHDLIELINWIREEREIEIMESK